MAANQHETSLKITGKNEASKPLKQATDDITRLEDAIKAGGAALDGNTGNLRNYAKTAQNVFKPLGEVAATAVGKITAAAEDLEKALEDANADIGVTKQQLRSYQDAAEAIQKQVAATQALRDAQDARRKSEASNLAHLKDAEEAHLALVKETSDAKIAGIFAEHDQSVQQRRDMQAQRKALIDNAKVEKAAYEDRKKRFSDEKDRLKQAMSVKGANLMGLLAQDAVNNRASKSNDDDYKAFRQDNMAQRKAFETTLAELDKRIAAQKAAADVEVQAVQKAATAERDASAARIKAQKDLTEATNTESKERMAALDKELVGLRKSRTEQNRLVTGTTKSLAAQEARAAAIGLDREQVSKVRDRAVSLQSQLTDPNAMRRLSREIVGGPESQARGMSALSEQTRRAADAQRLLNGQVKAGASGFSSARSYVMGLVSAYAIYATTITQASAAVDAFKTKQSFEITVSNTLGGDMSKAAGEFDYLSAAADKYGFSIATVGQEYAKLASTARGIGRSDKEIRSLFEGVLSVGRVNALSDEKMQDAFRAVTQILSKNQVMSEELKGQLAEALPGAVVRFAQSQGYSPDQMKEFSKDLESGKFASKDIIEYAQKELEDNAAAVLRAQGTFQATMARFQNTLFKSRADFAENGFMDELTATIRELDEFFKSEAGKAYMIRLGQGANVVVGFMASIAKNLDTILAVSGALLTIWGASVERLAIRTPLLG